MPVEQAGQYARGLTATSSGVSVTFVRSDTTGIALRANRFTVWNDGTSDLYLHLGPSSSFASSSGYFAAIRTAQSQAFEASRGYFTGFFAYCTTAANEAFRVLAVEA